MNRRDALRDWYRFPAFSLTLFPVCVAMVFYRVAIEPSPVFLLWLLAGAMTGSLVINWIEGLVR